MTTPQQSRGQPLFDQAAQETLEFTRQRPQYHPGLFDRALTDEEQAEAAKAEQARAVCRFCIGYHALPNSPGCPRLASFELDGDGNVKAGTFFAGRKWAEGRVVFYEDTKEQEAGDGDV